METLQRVQQQKTNADLVTAFNSNKAGLLRVVFSGGSQFDALAPSRLFIF